MYYFKNIHTLITLIILLFAQSCGNKKGIISEGDFAKIISEMYLADQYLEQNPQLKGQTDSLIVYGGIFNKYGYTIDNYKESVKFYIKKGDAYKKIHQQAKELLGARDKELNTILQIADRAKFWWAIDSIKTKNNAYLIHEPHLRSLKWIIMQRDTVQWKLLDSAVTDIPQNITWWKNNIDLVFNDTISKQYNILTKDYVLRIGKEKIQEGKEGKENKENKGNNDSIVQVEKKNIRKVRPMKLEAPSTLNIN